ncbi:MAG: prepilin-type N-terminal cleavage/methylation domain-containing protein [Lentisphaeria bacterium]|jgi:MSHA pilin protein MshA|nr:prepilin-type N-terminal cleavage/methylation domain-containing protein [Lentisphaeria bacterium]
MRRTNNFTLVEIIAVLLIIAIMAAVAAPKFINLADDAREGIAQAGINEAKASLSVAYVKAYLDKNKPSAAGGNPDGEEVLDAAGFTSGTAVDFGDVAVTMTAAAASTSVSLSAAYDGETVTDTWAVPTN